jgi:S-formylglutathione hydrolase FrmB
LLAADFVIVLPDGDDGWYIDSPVRRPDRYEAYLTEVIAVAERRYDLSSDRSRRALSGWSMGGYGCTHYATRHPERFGALAPIIGLLDFPRTGLPPGQSYAVPRDRFGDDPDVWRELNPLNHVERLRGMDLLVITADEAFDRTMNEHFHRRLEQRGIEHDWLVLEGGHTFDVVRRALPRVIEHARRAFVSTPESGE